MSYAGRYILKNPRKYMGVGQNPIYKSRMELVVFDRLDNDPKVIRWGYEILGIPYFSKLDKKMHTYKTDIFCEVKRGEVVERYVIEIKSSSDMVQPRKPNLMNPKSKARFNFAMKTYIVNTSKWQAAQAFCNKSGLKLIFLTEKDLGL